jgi:heterotetrameric sarcosine oxidase gamma subunit
VDSQTPFCAHVAGLPRADADIWIAEIVPATVVAVMARRGAADAASTLLRRMPVSHLLATGPGMWLLLADEGVGRPLGELEAELAEVAHLFDQSSGYGFLRLSGGWARRLLQKNIFVDLDTALARDGDVLCSLVGHIAVIAWRMADDSYGIAVPRSYADSFWHALTVSARADTISLGR